jgi:hypothetical protein
MGVPRVVFLLYCASVDRRARRRNTSLVGDAWLGVRPTLDNRPYGDVDR